MICAQRQHIKQKTFTLAERLIMNFHTVTKLQLLHEIFRLSSAIQTNATTTLR